MQRQPRPRLPLQRTTLKQLDAERLRAVVGGRVLERDASYVQSCAAYTGCGDWPSDQQAD